MHTRPTLAAAIVVATSTALSATPCTAQVQRYELSNFSSSFEIKYLVQPGENIRFDHPRDIPNFFSDLRVSIPYHGQASTAPSEFAVPPLPPTAFVNSKFLIALNGNDRRATFSLSLDDLRDIERSTLQEVPGHVDGWCRVTVRVIFDEPARYTIRRQFRTNANQGLFYFVTLDSSWITLVKAFGSNPWLDNTTVFSDFVETQPFFDEPVPDLAVSGLAEGGSTLSFFLKTRFELESTTQFNLSNERTNIDFEIELDIEPLGGCSLADLDGNNAIDTSDFAIYLDRWTASDPAADLTSAGECAVAAPDGQVTLDDFSCYLNIWSAGCD